MAEITLQNTPATLGDIANWNVGETTNPPAIGLANPGTGGVNGSAVYGSESEFAIEKDAVFNPTPFPDAQLIGSVESITVNGSVGVEANVDWSMSSYFGGLSVDRIAPPLLNQTLGAILQTYIGLVYDTPVTVNSTRIPLPGFDSTLYSFPGWSGSVWSHICDLLAKVGAEIVYWPDGNGQPTLEVRPMSSVTLDLDDKAPPAMRYESGSPGHRIDVVRQNQRVITSVLPDLTNYSENPSLESNDDDWDSAFMDHTSLTTPLRSVAWGADTFVTVGVNFAATSTDGLEWITRTIPNGSYESVAWNGSFFAAFDLTGNVSTSPDGITWTSQGAASEYMPRVKSGPSVFMGAIGSVLGVSGDGVNWSASFLSGNYQDITYGGGVFVAVGEGVAASSTNGASWTPRTIANRNFRAVTWGNSVFVAVGWDGTGSCVATSGDGITWTTRSAPVSVQGETVARGGNVFVMSDGVGVATSPDGVTWAVRPDVGSPVALPQMTYGDSIFVMVGNTGSLTSPNGDTWAGHSVSSIYLSASRENDATRSFAGDYSQRLRINVPSGIGITEVTTASIMKMPPCAATTLVGEVVTIGAWGMLYNNPAPNMFPSTGSARLLLTFLNSAGGIISRQWGSVVTSAGFSSWSGVIPTGTETLESSIFWLTSVTSDSGFGTDVRLHVDAHMIINAGSATYFDGSYPSAGWNGTPNNSTSLIPNPDNVPLYDAFEDNNNVMSVESGEVARFIITSGVYPTSILRPVPVDSLPIQVGNYHVIDSTGLPIIAQQWVDYGGEVNVTVGDGVGEIVVTITAPSADIPSTTGPYRLAASDGDNEYATLMVAGTGIITKPQTLNLLTGADRDKVTQELAATINSPFVDTLDDAYTVGTWLSAYSNGHYPVIDFVIPTSALGGVGLGPGSTFNFRDCKYRVSSVNWDNASCRGTAIRYSTIEDYEDAIGVRTIGDHDALWGAYTIRDFEIKSHRTV